jgi:hypothetical protein
VTAEPGAQPGRRPQRSRAQPHSKASWIIFLPTKADRSAAAKVARDGGQNVERFTSTSTERGRTEPDVTLNPVVSVALDWLLTWTTRGHILLPKATLKVMLTSSHVWVGRRQEGHVRGSAGSQLLCGHHARSPLGE